MNSTTDRAVTRRGRQLGFGLAVLEYRIRKDVLKRRHADYGEQIVNALSTQLSQEFGREFGKRNLLRMIRFAEVYDDPKIVSTLMTQLSWTHLLYTIPLQRIYNPCGGE